MSDWKRYFGPATLRDALAGNHIVLLKAFVWADTPEGYKFWAQQHANGLDEYGRARLRAMLAEYEGEKPVKGDPDFLLADEPTRTVPRIERGRRADATVAATVHENPHNLGTETGNDEPHRMGFKQPVEG